MRGSSQERPGQQQGLDLLAVFFLSLVRPVVSQYEKKEGAARRAAAGQSGRSVGAKATGRRKRRLSCCKCNYTVYISTITPEYKTLVAVAAPARQEDKDGNFRVGELELLANDRRPTDRPASSIDHPELFSPFSSLAGWLAAGCIPRCA